MSSTSGGSGGSSDVGAPGRFAGTSYKVWEDVSTTFTEFGALSSEKKQSGSFFSRLLKRKKDDDESVTTATNALGTGTSSDGKDDQKDFVGNAGTPSGRQQPYNTVSSDGRVRGPSMTSSAVGDESSVDTSTGGGEEEGAVPTRNLTSVLSRLSSILDQRSTTPQTYKDSDFKQYWMPDRSCKECYDCGDKFTTFRRRHHCRICGQIFCSKCCNQELPGKIIGYKGGIRVCTYCCRVVQRYAQTSSSTGDMRALEDLRAMSQQIYESGSFEFGGAQQSGAPRGPTDDLSPQYRESLPELSGLTTPDLSMPFDLTPQSEFSTEESLLRESKLLIQDSVQLRQLWRQVFDSEMGVETQTLRIRLRTHQNCIVGKELVDWLIKNDKAATRVQAIGIGQALLYAGYMECVGNQPAIFKDNFTLYRPGEMATQIDQQGEPEATPTITEQDEKTEPLWLKEIEKEDEEEDDDSVENDPCLGTLEECENQQSVSSQSESSRRLYYLNETSQSGSFSEMPRLTLMSRDLTEEPLPRQDPSVHGLGDDFLKGALFLGKAPMPSSDVVTCPHGWRIVEQLREENGEKLAYTRLKKAHSEHWQSLIRQMLSQNSLLLSWESVIAPCITQVSHFVRPDIRLEGDDMDIRNYVHIKKVPGGLKSDTNLTHGVIFTKNIAHKKMKTRITNPLILLLRGTIEFQRVEQKFSSLEPQILQEREFMRNCVMRLIAYRPNVIVVEKSVSRLAQEILLQCGVTLLYNVKLSVMERLARFTQAHIVPSIDGLVSKPNMGFCHDFRCQTFILPNKEVKTLAVFDGCATHLGCTIVLRGGTVSELRRVKQILKFMIHTAYNSLLELCFCMDEFALPQPMGDELTQSFHGADGDCTNGSPDHYWANRSIGNDELSNLAPKSEDQDNSNTNKQQQQQLPSSSSSVPTISLSRRESSASCSGSDVIGKLEDLQQQQRENENNSRISSEDHTQNDTTHTSSTATIAAASDENNKPFTNEAAKTESNNIVTVSSLNHAASSDTLENASTPSISSGPSSRSLTSSGTTPSLLTLTTASQKVRHYSGISSSSGGGLSREDNSGRSSPEIFTTEQQGDSTFWDGEAKVVAGILCVIPRTEVDPPPLKPRIRCSNSESMRQQHQHDVANILAGSGGGGGGSSTSDFEDSSCDFVDSLDYTIIDMAECEERVQVVEEESESATVQDDKNGNSSSNTSAVVDHHQPVVTSTSEKESIPIPPTTFRTQKSSSNSTSGLTVTELTDFSDPLLGYLNTKDESIFHSENQGKISLKEIKQSNYKRFRKALDGVHLSISPYHKYVVPFIETNKGLQCNSRKYLPENIFWSRLFDGEGDQKMYKTKTVESSDVVAKPENIEILTSHHFLTCDLTQPIWDTDMQTILADFRARGGRIRVKTNNRHSNSHHLSIGGGHDDTTTSNSQTTTTTSTTTTTTTNGRKEKEKEKDKEKEKETDVGPDGMIGVNNNNLVWEKKIDCLDPMNHQRLMVLFSSFSFKSSNHPHPCVYPWVVTMDFYGRNDITLGGFLERFCFRKQYLCPSPSCDIPMTEHIRRFVHGTACINVLLKKLDSEVPGGKENILMWSWCRKCKQVTPVVPISADTWSLSFAKYLDLRFHSSTFLRRASAEPCPHSLHHEHFQYFGHRDIVASFKYSTVSLRELALPSPTLLVKPPVFDSTSLLFTVRRVMHRATERYSQIWESTMKLKQEMTSETQARVISEFFHDQQHDKTRFRDAATNVQMKIQELVSKVCASQSKNHSDLDLTFQLTAILDNIALLKRIISEDVARWNARLQEFVTHQQKKSRTQLRKEKDLGSLDEAALEKSTKVPSSSDRFSAGKSIMSTSTAATTIPSSTTTNLVPTTTTAATTASPPPPPPSSSIPTTTTTSSSPSSSSSSLSTSVATPPVVSTTTTSSTSTSPLVVVDVPPSPSGDSLAPPAVVTTTSSSSSASSSLPKTSPSFNNIPAPSTPSSSSPSLPPPPSAPLPPKMTTTTKDIGVKTVELVHVTSIMGSQLDSSLESSQTYEDSNDSTPNVTTVDDNNAGDANNPVGCTTTTTTSTKTSDDHDIDDDNKPNITSTSPPQQADVASSTETTTQESSSSSPATTTTASTACTVTSTTSTSSSAHVEATPTTTTTTTAAAAAAAGGGLVTTESETSATVITDTDSISHPPPPPSSSQPALLQPPSSSSSSSPSSPSSSVPSTTTTTPSGPPPLQQSSVSATLAPTTNEVDDSTDGWLQDLKGVTRRWLSNSSFTPLALPFELNEHHSLPICEKVPIAVYDNEPSSIIAYALSSSDYLCRLREVQTAARCSNNDGSNQGAPSGKQASKQDTGKSSSTGGEGQQEPGRKTKVLSFLRGNTNASTSTSSGGGGTSKDKESLQASSSVHHPSSSTPSGVTVDSVRYIPTPDREESGSLQDDLGFLDDDSPSPDDKLKGGGSNSPSPHIQLQFSDSMAKFYCRIYFADQFRKLRKLILPGNDMTFIRSLSRCKPWEAKGGKSGSAFSKTDDDRFILKQMSTMELDSFEKFGPQYFTYIKNSLAERQPTALAKILGVFRIGFRNSQTNTALRQDLLVMENLFYDRKISQKFDLKGSIRNRMVSTAGRQAEEELVLLDENLLKTSVESPLYLRPHNKHVLKSAITSDTVFLSSNLVMDYSLLVGIVEDTDEMVVGIIDYIRTFTWDKKLEMVFKSSGILGGQGKMPTVVSPQLYRGRFLEAMDRYFLHVPDRWTGLGVDYPMKQMNQEGGEQQALH